MLGEVLKNYEYKSKLINYYKELFRRLKDFSINSNKSNNGKYYIKDGEKVLNIICGLPGSGKGKIPDIMKKLLNIKGSIIYKGIINNHTTVKNKNKNEINKIKIKYKNKINNKSFTKENLHIISNELTKLYFNTKLPNEKYKNSSVSNTYNVLLESAISSNLKYVSHESIGEKGFNSGTFRWLIPLAHKYKYKVIITYMYIELI